MHNRFGFKDFVVVVLGGLTLLVVVLSKLGGDRQFRQVEDLEAQVRELSRSVATIQRELRSGAGTAGLSSADLQRLLAGGGPSARDESWARPGYPITWPARWTRVHRPQDHPDFREGGAFMEVFEAQMNKATPHTFSDVYGRRVVREMVCEQLANYNSTTLRLEGWLAEAWQYDPDGLWLRVKIRDEARFSDGAPVTAEDVRFTYMDVIFNEAIEAAHVRSVVEAIEDVEVVSEKVCEFKFREAVYSNLESAMRYEIIPKHFYERFTPTQMNQSTALLMGSGPYKLKNLDPDNQWTPGETLTLVRNEQYWGERPPIDEHRFQVIVDDIARLTAFENGRADLIRATPPQYDAKASDERFLERGSAHAWNNMKSGYAYIAWNGGERNGVPTPFADPRVRRAMTHLLNREFINNAFYEGLAAVAYGPFNPATPQCNPDLAPLPFDEDEAARLLTEAGWVDTDNDGVRENERGDEFVFSFMHSTGSTLGPKVGKYLQAQCESVGVRCNIEVVDWSIQLERKDNRDFDAMTLAWSQSAPESDPRQIFHTDAIKNQGDNYVQWGDDESDALIERARATLDFDERQKLWHELHARIHDEQPYTFLLFIPWIRFVSNDVGNFHEHAVGMDKHEMFMMMDN